MTLPRVCPQCGSEYMDPEQRFCPRDGSSLRSPTAGDDLIGQVVADRYQVLEKIGEGGMGRVYLAEHLRMGRKSALKVMNPGMARDPDAVVRFNREASNASRIVHPNVVATFDFGETRDGLLYLAMEYVEGEPLSRVIAATGVLPLDRVVHIATQAAEALSFAHRLGIVHRDLKPDNIMIGRDIDGRDLVKVVDFGIAKATRGSTGNGHDLTRTGLSMGTPEYMSPEQLAGDTVDFHTDIYSLGLSVFHALTGQLPFPEVTSRETLVARLTERPATLAERRPDLPWPAGLQKVLDRALSIDPGARNDSAVDFARELATAAEGTPVLAPRRSSISAQFVAAGNSGLVPFLVAMALVFAALGAGAYVFWHQRTEPAAQTVVPPPAPRDTVKHVAVRDTAHAVVRPAVNADSAARAELDLALIAARRALTEGLRLTSTGDYAAAATTFKGAIARLDAVPERAGTSEQVLQLRQDIVRAASRNRTACDAIAEEAQKRGETPPPCE